MPVDGAAVGPDTAIDEVVTLIAGDAPGRVNDSGPQVLHDLTLALAHFLAERPLPSRVAARAIRRATRATGSGRTIRSNGASSVPWAGAT